MGKKYKVKILRGSHRVGPELDKQGNVVHEAYNAKKGDVIETDVNLPKRFPSRPPKFQLVNEVAESEDDIRYDLQRMTVDQLNKKAHDEEVDLTGANTKNEKIDRILKKMG